MLIWHPNNNNNTLASDFIFYNFIPLTEERKSKKHKSEVDLDSYDVDEDSQDVDNTTGKYMCSFIITISKLVLQIYHNIYFNSVIFINNNSVISINNLQT